MRFGLGAVVMAVLLALAPFSAQAKVAVDSFGFAGASGGRLNDPEGIAINHSGAGGVAPNTLYLSDVNEGNAHGKDANRIEALGPEGGFERLWGLDVVGPNEIQRVAIGFGASGDTLGQAVGGEFSLEFGGEEVEFKLEAQGSTIKPTSQELQSGLEALPSIGAGNVRVRGELDTNTAGGSYEIEFTGTLGGTDLPQIAIDGSQILGPPPITTSATTVQDGSGGNFAGFEICTVAAECKRGSTAEPARGGQVKSPGAIAVDQSTGNVYVADNGDHRIEEFDAKGNFIRAWGWDVVESGGSGDVSEDAFEICTVAAQCKAGKSSEAGGAVGSAGSLVLDPAGHVWITDQSNRRFEEFGANGGFIAAYGWDVDATGGSGELEKCTSTAPGDCQAATTGSALGQFGGSPGSMAIDSAGNVYVIGGANQSIEHFDPGMTTASLFAADLLKEAEEAGLPSFSPDNLLATPDGFLLTAHTSTEDWLLELDGSGQFVEASLEGDGLPQVTGLALNETTGAVYATVVNAVNHGPGVAVIDDGPAPDPPALEIEPATGIGGEEATLHATVDPGGQLVANCRFEYSTDQVSWEKVEPPVDCSELDREGGPQQVSETLAGLEPATHYFVRFTAGRYYYAHANETSDETELRTESLPPLVSDVGAALITETSAYLAGEVKPRSQGFEYHFEYGTTPALGSSTPTVQLSGVKPSEQRIVAKKLEGLLPDTTYYLRLVATNVAGTTKSPLEPGPPASFSTRPEGPPPEQRAYEQVTPPVKNFNNIEGAYAALDGEALLFRATVGFGDPAGQVGEVSTTYRAARTKEGWRSRWHNEPYCAKDLQETHHQPATGGAPSGFSQNLDFLAILRPESAACVYPPLDPAAPVSQTNLYRADYHSEPVATEPLGYQLLAPEPGGEELFLKQSGGEYAGASADWSRVFYTSNGWQQPSPPPGSPGNFAKVFEWQEGAPPKLVSVDPAGNPFTEGAVVPEDALHGVSQDGKRVFFMTPGPVTSGACQPSSCEIYMRQNGSKTFDVSRSECTSACGESSADSFLAATPDGAKVLFMSKAKLSDEDTAGNGSDLYLYTHGANPNAEQNLTLLSKDEEAADGTGARVLGLLGMSENAEVAYFVADGRLVAGAPSAVGPKLYRWSADGGSPTLTYLATLAPGSEDSGNWTGHGSNETRASVRLVSADGGHIILDSAARIDPGADHDSTRDVYRWDQKDGWLCLSCQQPESASAGDATLSQPGPGDAGSHYANAMSEDGSRVFFATSDALLPADTNERRDVYEWHENGALSLISSGSDERNVSFIGISASGRDAFFSTYEPLVGWDTDRNSDIYDARVEEHGFPEPPPTEIPCDPNTPGACEGPVGPVPSVPGAGTASFEGPPPSKPCRKGKVRRHGRCVNAHKHNRGKKQHKRSGRRAAGGGRGGAR